MIHKRDSAGISICSLRSPPIEPSFRPLPEESAIFPTDPSKRTSLLPRNNGVSVFSRAVFLFFVALIASDRANHPQFNIGQRDVAQCDRCVCHDSGRFSSSISIRSRGIDRAVRCLIRERCWPSGKSRGEARRNNFLDGMNFV